MIEAGRPMRYRRAIDLVRAHRVALVPQVHARRTTALAASRDTAARVPERLGSITTSVRVLDPRQWSVRFVRERSSLGMVFCVASSYIVHVHAVVIVAAQTRALRVSPSPARVTRRGLVFRGERRAVRK